MKVARTVWVGGKSLVDYLSTLSRRVVMANSHILLDDSIEDCGTTRYFKLQVDESIAKLIKNRYIVGSTGKPKLIKDPTELIGKTVNLRSPLYCKCPDSNICPICYGDSWKELHNKNIGVLIGGDINDKALNAYINFHVCKKNKNNLSKKC